MSSARRPLGALEGSPRELRPQAAISVPSQCASGGTVGGSSSRGAGADKHPTRQEEEILAPVRSLDPIDTSKTPSGFATYLQSSSSSSGRRMESACGSSASVSGPAVASGSGSAESTSSMAASRSADQQTLSTNAAHEMAATGRGASKGERSHPPLSERAVAILEDWFERIASNPYPTAELTERLAIICTTRQMCLVCLTIVSAVLIINYQ